MCDKVGGRDKVGACKYAPLYKNGIKKTPEQVKGDYCYDSLDDGWFRIS